MSTVNSHVFLPKNYDFRILIRLSSILLPVTPNKGSIRVKFQFVWFTPKKSQFPCVLPKNYDFWDLIKRLSSSLLTVTSNEVSIGVKSYFVRFTPKKCQLWLSSPHKATGFLSYPNFKYGVKFNFFPIRINSHVFWPKSYN